MAAGNWTAYTKALQSTFTGALNWGSANIRMILLNNSYTPDYTATGNGAWSDVSTYQISGTGYTAGGVAATSPAVASSGSTVTASGGSSSWASSTITVRYAVLVLSTGGATPNTTDLLLASCDLGGGSTVSTTNSTLTVSGYSVAVTHTP